MNRILNLQSMTAAVSADVLQKEDSTSSGSSCACSTASAIACYMGDDLVAI